MLEAFYNLALLTEIGLMTYGYSKVVLDYLWSITLRFLITYDLLEIDELNELWDYVNHFSS